MDSGWWVDATPITGYALQFFVEENLVLIQFDKLFLENSGGKNAKIFIFTQEGGPSHPWQGWILEKTGFSSSTSHTKKHSSPFPLSIWTVHTHMCHAAHVMFRSSSPVMHWAVVPSAGLSCSTHLLRQTPSIHMMGSPLQWHTIPFLYLKKRTVLFLTNNKTGQKKVSRNCVTAIFSALREHCNRLQLLFSAFSPVV